MMVNETSEVRQVSSDASSGGDATSIKEVNGNNNNNESENNVSISSNGHSSPVHDIKTSPQSQSPVNHHQQQMHVSNGDVASSAIVLTSSSDARYSLAGQQVLQPHEIYIKAEPMDPMPPLASPMQNPREMEDSPPATLISLTPAQPAYDVNGGGQYNGHVVYLTMPTSTDYRNYQEYTYGGTPTIQLPVQASDATDQYQAVRQQLTSTPAVTYTTQAVIDGQPSQEGSTTSFLDRYLRQPPVSSATVVSAHTVYNGQLQGGLTVDLPSPDSGIGETIATPRPENGILAQVRLLAKTQDSTDLPSSSLLFVSLSLFLSLSKGSSLSFSVFV
jgi:hypothetical protein